LMVTYLLKTNTTAATNVINLAVFIQK
jgi:hypothetical protein